MNQNKKIAKLQIKVAKLKLKLMKAKEVNDQKITAEIASVSEVINRVNQLAKLLSCEPSEVVERVKGHTETIQQLEQPTDLPFQDVVDYVKGVKAKEVEKIYTAENWDKAPDGIYAYYDENDYLSTIARKIDTYMDVHAYRKALYLCLLPPTKLPNG